MSEDKTVEVVNETADKPVENENVVEEASNESEVVESKEAEAAPEEKISFTQEELNNHSAKLQAKAERKAARKLDAEYQKKYEELQKTQQQVQQSTVNQVSPGPDYVYDPIVGYVHKDTTAEQKLAMIEQALVQANASQQPQQPIQQQAAPAPVNEVQQPVGSERLIDQLEDFAEIHPDWPQTLASVNIKLDMLENAALYKDGLKTLYEEAKNNPSKIFKISSLTDEKERNLRMFELNDSKKDNSKKVSKVPPQPEPITGGSSIGAKSPDKMSADELREKYIREL